MREKNKQVFWGRADVLCTYSCNAPWKSNYHMKGTIWGLWAAGWTGPRKYHCYHFDPECPPKAWCAHQWRFGKVTGSWQQYSWLAVMKAREGLARTGGSLRDVTWKGASPFPAPPVSLPASQPPGQERLSTAQALPPCYFLHLSWMNMSRVFWNCKPKSVSPPLNHGVSYCVLLLRKWQLRQLWCCSLFKSLYCDILLRKYS